MSEQNIRDINRGILKNSRDKSEIGAFNDLEYYAFLHKKTEKLSGAVYLITNNVPERDPLKRRIRSTCIDIISDMSLIAGEVSHKNTQIHESLQMHIVHILNLINTAVTAGYIAPINARVLQREYVSLSNNALDYLNKGGERNTTHLAPEDFDVATLYKETVLNRQISQVSQKGQNKSDKKEVYKTDKVSHEPLQAVHDVSETTVPKKTKTAVRIRHKERREIILKLLEKKNRVSIKDVTSLIQDCGEKTIQRELTSMVKEGVLKKEGERRWSTYSLA